MTGLYIFAFIFQGAIHATGVKLSEQECREQLASTPGPTVCISVDHHSDRIYSDVAKPLAPIKLRDAARKINGEPIYVLTLDELLGHLQASNSAGRRSALQEMREKGRKQ